MSNVVQYQITQDYIELIKLLKLLNLCESGADAKRAVEDGLVICNDVIEYRKRKKLIKGDIIKFNTTVLKII